MTVLIYDHAGVTPETLAKAAQVLSRIFVKTGIEVKTLECSIPGMPHNTAPGCLRPLGSADLVLRIEPRVRPNQERVLGVSQGVAYAIVYHQRVLESAAEKLASEAEILGYGMAHEIGHLLLQVQGHATNGIMRRQWGTLELVLMRVQNLHFSREEAKTLRIEVKRRNQLPELVPGDLQLKPFTRMAQGCYGQSSLPDHLKFSTIMRLAVNAWCWP